MNPFSQLHELPRQLRHPAVRDLAWTRNAVLPAGANQTQGAAIERSAILFTEMNHGFINPVAEKYRERIAKALDDRAIDRHLFARSHAQLLADGDRLDRHFRILSVGAEAQRFAQYEQQIREEVEVLAKAIASPLTEKLMLALTQGAARYRLSMVSEGNHDDAVAKVTKKAFELNPRVLNDARESPWSVDVHFDERSALVELRPRISPNPRISTIRS